MNIQKTGVFTLRRAVADELARGVIKERAFTFPNEDGTKNDHFIRFLPVKKEEDGNGALFGKFTVNGNEVQVSMTFNRMDIVEYSPEVNMGYVLHVQLELELSEDHPSHPSNMGKDLS